MATDQGAKWAALDIDREVIDEKSIDRNLVMSKH